MLVLSVFVHVTFRRKAFVPAVRSTAGTTYVAAVWPLISVQLVPPLVDCCHWRATVSPAAPVHVPSMALRVRGVDDVGVSVVVTVGRTRTVPSVSPYVTVGLEAVIVTGRRLMETLPLM